MTARDDWLGIRLSKEERRELKEIAKTHEMKDSDLGRRAIKALIRHVQKHGGRLQLPIEFDDVRDNAELPLAAEERASYGNASKKKRA